MGGGNYIKEAPPYSYIDVKDFKSVKSLAEYLKTLLRSKVSHFCFNFYDFFKTIFLG